VCDVVYTAVAEHRGPSVVATALSVNSLGVTHSGALYSLQ
jgi:hypothetical protein